MSKNISQERILDEIADERVAQDREYGGAAHDDRLQANDWLAIAVRHLGLAASDEAKIDPPRYRRQLIRLAAIAVAAVESYDRTHTAGLRTPEQLGKGY